MLTLVAHLPGPGEAIDTAIATLPKAGSGLLHQHCVFSALTQPKEMKSLVQPWMAIVAVASLSYLLLLYKSQ